MTQIYIAIAILGAIGLLGGILLSVVSAICGTQEENERLAKLKEALPGANCGACGFAGCDSYAEALDANAAEPGLCAPGGAAAAKAISEIMGVKIDIVKKVARVNCNGCHENTDTKYNYDGLDSCAAAAALGGGPMQCEYGCIGLGDCVGSCKFNALDVLNGVAMVNKEICTGCGKCANTCPKELITLVPYKRVSFIPCSNKNKGAVARKQCKAACIGCMACVRSCEYDAVTVKNFLAEVDAEKCTACGKCVEACPQKIIRIV